MPRKKRKSISVKGLTYWRLKRWCEDNNVSISGIIEKWANADLQATPLLNHHLYEAKLDGEQLFAVASDEGQARTMLAEEFDVPGEALTITQSEHLQRFTYALYGILKPEEIGVS